MLEWYTPEQLGARLQIQPRTLLEQARNGSIPGAKKVGRQWRFNVSKIDAWLDETSSPIIPPIPTEQLSPDTAAKLSRINAFRRK